MGHLIWNANHETTKYLLQSIFSLYALKKKYPSNGKYSLMWRNLQRMPLVHRDSTFTLDSINEIFHELYITSLHQTEMPKTDSPIKIKEIDFIYGSLIKEDGHFTDFYQSQGKVKYSKNTVFTEDFGIPITEL